MSSDGAYFFFLDCIYKKNIAGAKSFINSGIDINKPCKFRHILPLFIAIDNLDPQMCELLCSSGAVIGNALGYLLSKAPIKERALDVMRLRIILTLLRYGANPDLTEGNVSARMVLDSLGYKIENRCLVTKKYVAQLMDIEADKLINSMEEDTIEFRDTIAPTITMD